MHYDVKALVALLLHKHTKVDLIAALLKTCRQKPTVCISLMLVRLRIHLIEINEVYKNCLKRFVTKDHENLWRF